MEAGLFGYVGKGAIAIIAVKAIGCRGGRMAEARPGQEKQVHPSVVVVVDECAAASHGLEDILLLLLLAVQYRLHEARFPGHVHEMRMEGNSGRLSSGLWLHTTTRYALANRHLARAKRKSHQANNELPPLNCAH